MSDETTPPSGILGSKSRAYRGFSRSEKVLIGFIVLIGVALILPAFNKVSAKGLMMQSASNARQIIITLKNYASDCDGHYPRGKTSNEVFRELFKRGLLEDERVFTSAGSPYEGDDVIGDSPDYTDAVKPGENHWAMTNGLSDKTSGDAPLIFENPAVVSWPSFWNADAAIKTVSSPSVWHDETPLPKVPGRVWHGGRIVIGRNDGSVKAERLESTTGKAVTLKRNAEGKNLFEAAGPHEILDIER